MAGTSSPEPCSAPSTELDARWASRQAPAERAALVDAYMPLVRRIAVRCFQRRADTGLPFADYLQFGTVGLLEAIDRYTPARGVRFDSYASYRIEGAILNGVPTLSDFHAQVHARRGLLAQRTDSLSAEADDDPQDGAPQSALQRLAEVAIGLALGFALEDAGLYLDGERTQPDLAYHRLEMKQLAGQAEALLTQLSEAQALVIRRHYFQQLPFEEIARSMNLSRGRVSQIHGAGLRRLRQLLQQARALDSRG